MSNWVDLTKTNWRTTITDPDAQRLLITHEARKHRGALMLHSLGIALVAFMLALTVSDGLYEASAVAIFAALITDGFGWCLSRWREHQAENVVNERLRR